MLSLFRSLGELLDSVFIDHYEEVMAKLDNSAETYEHCLQVRR